MNIVIVSPNGGLAERTTFANFTRANADALDADLIRNLGEVLQKRGVVEFNEHSLINVTPTEADVVAFMEAKACELSEKLGGLYTHVSVEAVKYSRKGGAATTHEFRSYVDGDIGRNAPTLADAMQASVLAMDPGIRAHELRAKAEAMLAEAAALKPVAA